MPRTLRTLILMFLVILSLVPSAPVAAESAQGVPSFSDIPDDHPDRAYIMFLANKGLISGYPDGRFGPADSLTRAAVTKIAVQVSGYVALPAGATLDFRDVPEGHWAIPWIRAGVASKLVTGFEDKSFRPDQPVTRAELAVLALRAIRQTASKAPQVELHDAQPSDWFYQAAMLAVATGIMEAPNGNFRPNDIATRGEAARALARAMIFTPLAFDTPLPILVTPKNGQVEVQQPDQQAFERIVQQTALKEGGRVRTAGASAAEIGFPDGSSLYLDNLSELIIHKSHGAELVTTTGVEDLDVELVRGKLLFSLTPRLDSKDLAQYAPAIAAYHNKESDERAAVAMRSRVRAAHGAAENLPANATRLLLFSDPASLEPGDKEGTELTIVLANEAGEPVTADKGPVAIDLLSDVGTFSNSEPFIPEGYQAVTVTLFPPDEEPDDGKTRVTASTSEISTSLTIPTSKVSWWKALFSKKTRAKVRMPWSVASVRGTVGLAEVTPQKNTAATLVGSVALTSNSGDTVEAGPAQEATADKRQDQLRAGPLGEENQRNFRASNEIINAALKKQAEQANQEIKEVVQTANEVASNIIQSLPKDTTPPSISIMSPASEERLGTSTITLKGVASDNVELTSVSVSGSSVSVDAQGNWTAPVTLQPGPNTITATAADGEGNTSSTALTLYFDAGRPWIEMQAPQTTREKSVELSGHAVAPAGLQAVTINGADVAVDASGAFHATATLQPGANLITAEVTDRQGQKATTELQIISASEPPVLSLADTQERVADPNFILSGRAIAQYADLESVTVAGNPVLFDSDGSFTAVLKLVHRFTQIPVVAKDTAGNTTTVTRTVIYDIALPVIKIVSPRQGLITRDEKVKVTVQAKAVAGIKSLTLPDGQTISGEQRDAYTTEITLQPGENILTAELEDTLNRKVSDSSTVYLLAKPPSLAVSQPEDGQKVANAEITVAGVAAAAFGPLRGVTVNGVILPLNTDGSFSTTITLTSGENQIRVAATDWAGNTSETTRRVTFNAASPILALEQPANGLITKDAFVSVSGRVENGEGVSAVSINGQSVGLGAGGTFSTRVPLGPGKNSISVALPQEKGGASVERTVIFADRPPSLVVTSPESGETANPIVLVAGSALTSYGTPGRVSINGLVVAVNSAGGFSRSLQLRPKESTVITVTARDEAGNETTETRTLAYNPAVPLITITEPSDDTTTKESQVTVRGRVTTTVGVDSIEVNGQSAAVDADGNFSATIALQPGPTTLVVVVRDKAGGTATVSRKITRGGIPPELVVNTPPDGFLTGQERLSVSGTAKSVIGKIASVTINGAGAAVAPNGRWEGQVALTPGENTLTIVASDSLGGSSTVSRSVFFAQGAPSLLLATPAEGAVVRENSVVVSGLAKASTPSLSVSINGSPVSVSATGAFQSVVSGLQKGKNSITVQVSDSASPPRTTSITRTVIVANEPPVIQLTSPEEGATLTEPQVRVAGSVSTTPGVSLASLTINGASASFDRASGRFTATVPLHGDASGLITVRATDSAGNSAEVSRRVIWQPRTLEISISSPLAGSTVESDTISVTGSIKGGGQRPVSVTVNSIPATVTGETFTARISLTSPLIQATATDSLGRTASTDVRVTFKPPTLAIASPESGATVTVAAATISGSAASLYGNLMVLVGGQSFALGKGGTFSANVSLIPGQNNMTVTAKDAFGEKSLQVSITYNPPVIQPPAPPPTTTNPPTISITEPADGLIATTNQVTVSGTFTAQAGLGSLVLMVNNTASTVTVPTGASTFNHVATLAPGANSITVTITDSQNRSASTAARIIYFPSLKTAPVFGQPGEAVTLRARLLPALPNKRIDFAVNGGAVGSALTDANGLAELPYTIAANATAGPLSVAASLTGNIGTTPLVASTTLSIAPSAAKPRLRLIPRLQPGGSNTELLVDLLVDNVPSNLGSVAAEFQYDATHLAALPTIAGPLLGGPDHQSIDLAGAADSTIGTLRFNISNPHGAAADQKLLATLRFTVKQSTTPATFIHFFPVSANTSNGVQMLDLSGEAILATDPPIGTDFVIQPQ